MKSSETCRHSQWEYKLVGSTRTQVLGWRHHGPFCSRIPPWGYVNEIVSSEPTYGRILRGLFWHICLDKNKMARTMSPLQKRKGLCCKFSLTESPAQQHPNSQKDWQLCLHKEPAGFCERGNFPACRCCTAGRGTAMEASLGAVMGPRVALCKHTKGREFP